MADGLDVFSRGGGWGGFGLTGLLLSWILLISIPAKDKQMRVMIERQDAEREKDRVARHELAGKFQDVMTAVMAQHIRDAENDRASFMTRHIQFEDALSKVQEAISRQTLELTKEDCGLSANLAATRTSHDHPHVDWIGSQRSAP